MPRYMYASIHRNCSCRYRIELLAIIYAQQHNFLSKIVDFLLADLLGSGRL